jgi:hypothetical protein
MSLLFRRCDEGLPKSSREQDEHIQSLMHLSGAAPGPHQTVFRFLYDNLTIVDAKTAALLQFNGVLLATQGIVFPVVLGGKDQFVGFLEPLYFPLLLLLLLAGGLSLTSCLLSLNQIWLTWLSTEDLKHVVTQLEAPLRKLLKERDHRTRRYRRSLRIAYLGIWCFIAFCLVATFVVVVHGLDERLALKWLPPHP